MNRSLRLSQHARVRMQQRGIPTPVLEWLAAYGEINHQSSAELYYFSQRSHRELKQNADAAALRRYAKALDAYMVCAEGQVTTVGHRYQRVIRH